MAAATSKPDVAGSDGLKKFSNDELKKFSNDPGA
jgi:hypothetical protein